MVERIYNESRVFLIDSQHSIYRVGKVVNQSTVSYSALQIIVF